MVTASWNGGQSPRYRAGEDGAGVDAYPIVVIEELASLPTLPTHRHATPDMLCGEIAAADLLQGLSVKIPMSKWEI